MLFMRELKKVKKDILEDEKTKPNLSYALSKDINEKQLMASGKNYVILRLGSVYGYSSDTMRVDIILIFKNYISERFNKMFAGGRQIKSLVPSLMLLDVLSLWKKKKKFTQKYLI